MKSMITNYRLWVLVALGAVAAVTLLSEPTATTVAAWLLTLVVSKGVGIASVCLAIRLFRRWARRGEIDCLTKLITEE